MANYRAVALEPTGFGNIEIADTDTLLVGNIAPSSGDLTIGGATATDGVAIAAGHDLDMSGDGVFNLAGTGNLNVTASGTHAISGGTLDVDVASDFSGTMTLSGGADLVGTSGSTIGTFDGISTVVGGTIGGIVQESLLDKTANETVTGQWTFQSTTDPPLIVKASGGEPTDTLLFQVQTSAGANLFSVDTEGDVVIAGGETVAGTTVYTGNVTLGDGNNTIQLGSAATPAQGDNVFINTTGTADGSFSVTTANYTIDTSGNVVANSFSGTLLQCGTDCNAWVTNQDAAAGTSEYAGSVWLDGDGGTNIEGWRWRNDGSTPDFQLQYKQNPTLATDLAEAWTDIITATPTAVTVNAPTFNATTGNFTTITGNFTGTIGTCGTSCNQWEINDDAVAGTAEDVGVMFPGGDGVNVQNFQFFNDTSAAQMILRYKQDPTDPADMAEGGYTNILTATSTQVTIPVNVDATAGLDVTGAALTVDANGIDSAGNIDLNNTLSFDAAGFIDTSGNNDLTINTGTQDVLVTAGTVDLQTNVTTLDVPSNTGFSIGGTALTSTLWTATAHDVVFGGPASNADSYHTHSGSGASCGTTCNQWEINDDAVAGTAEDVGVMFPGGDGVNVQNFQFFNDTSAAQMILRYKQDPTDPADMAEGGYTNILTATSTQVTIPVNVDVTNGLDVTGAALTVDASGIDSAGNIDLNNTLSFDAAGFIDTSGNNDLTISTGTQDVLVTAGTVDLQTNVTTLDVPSNTGFSIGGTALTTTSFTATAADIIFGDGTGDADPYHTHSSTGAADQVVIDGLTTAAMTQYQAGYVSANNTITPTDCSSGTGTYLTATFAGVYDNTAGEVVNTGKIEVQFDSGLSPAPIAGDPAILSWLNSGQYRNRPPASGSGHFFTWAGIVLDASTYGANQRCVIVIQPGRPVKR